MKNIFDKKLASTTLSFFFLQGLNYIFPLLLIPLLTLRLGLNSYGTIVFHQVICAQLLIFAEWGFLWSSTREISSNIEDKNLIARVFTLSFIAQLILSVLGSVAVCLYLLLFDAVNIKFGLYYALMLGGNILYVQWLFQGAENMRYFIFSQVTSKIITLTLIFIFVDGPGDAFRCLIFFGLSHMICGSLAYYFSRKMELHTGFVKCGLSDIFRFMDKSKSLFFVRIVSSVSANSPILFLGLMSSSDSVALFSLADKVRLAGQSILSPLMQALSIRMNLRFKTSFEDAMKEFSILLKFTIISSSLLSILVFLFSGKIINLFGGVNFQEAEIILKILSPLITLVSVSNVIGGQFLIPCGQYDSYSRVMIYSAVISTPLISIFIFYFNSMGAAFGIMCAEILVLVMLFLLLKNNKRSYVL